MKKTALGALGLMAAGAGVSFILWSEYERDCLAVEGISIVSEKVRAPKRLVFLSDLHNKEFGPENARLIKAIDQAEPDAVLIGGDMMVSKGMPGVSVAVSLIEKLAEKYPVYYGNGNHENRMVWERSVYGSLYEQYRDRLEKLGVIYLENNTSLIGEDVAVSGADLKKKHYRKLFFQKPRPLEKDYLYNCLGKADEKRFQILLIHSPMYFKESAAWGADLTLSGHFHGGTIRLPLLGGVMTPQYQFFLPWCAGSFEDGGKRMVVSRGLGTHSINIRINNKPQVILLDLKPAVHRVGKTGRKPL